jgi:hypothetical protein
VRGFIDRCPISGAVTYAVRRDGSDFVAFCFSNSEDAQALGEPFGGKRLRSVRR